MKKQEKTKILKHLKKDEKEFKNQIEEDKELKKSLKISKR